MVIGIWPPPCFLLIMIFIWREDADLSEHYSMPLIKHSKISKSSSLRAFYSISSLKLPHIQSLVTGQWENGRLIGVGGHLIDRAGMVRQLIQNLPACGIPHTHKPVGWASCYLASFRWPRPSQEILFKVVHITKFIQEKLQNSDE